MPDRSCIICSAVVPPPSRALCCSKRCLNRRAYDRSKVNGKYEKMLQRKTRHYHERNPTLAMYCTVCAVDLGPGRKDRRFCSPKCSRDGQPKGCSVVDCERPLRAKGMCNKHYRLERGEKTQWTEAKRDGYHRRRALKAGTSSGRPVILSEIRERDGNRCHLCLKAVPDKAWPHPQSPSLDHVIPLSKGGAHDPANVKLAHLVCNTAKGNRGGNEQMLLIG